MGEVARCFLSRIDEGECCFNKKNSGKKTAYDNVKIASGF